MKAPRGESRAGAGARWAWGRLYCLAAGACDTATGALLVALPLPTLALMGVPAPACETVFLRYIGAFVAAVGLLYLYPFAVEGRAPWRRLPTVVEATALVRCGIAAFVALAVAVGSLAAAWLSVAAVDAGLAAAQLVLLRRGFFGRGGDG